MARRTPVDFTWFLLLSSSVSFSNFCRLSSTLSQLVVWLSSISSMLSNNLLVWCSWNFKYLILTTRAVARRSQAILQVDPAQHVLVRYFVFHCRLLTPPQDIEDFDHFHFVQKPHSPFQWALTIFTCVACCIFDRFLGSSNILTNNKFWEFVRRWKNQFVNLHVFIRKSFWEFVVESAFQWMAMVYSRWFVSSISNPLLLLHMHLTALRKVSIILSLTV
jgi:hypothetical protein